jgi:hypothetical protein
VSAGLKKISQCRKYQKLKICQTICERWDEKAVPIPNEENGKYQRLKYLPDYL